MHLDEYTQQVPEAGVKQNGKLSLGEDTADNWRNSHSASRPRKHAKGEW